MTVGHFTIRACTAADKEIRAAYHAQAIGLLDELREHIPPFKKSDGESSVRIEETDQNYIYRFRTPMDSDQIRGVILDTVDCPNFRLLPRPKNIHLVP